MWRRTRALELKLCRSSRGETSARWCNHIGGKAALDTAGGGLDRVPREMGIAGGRVDPPTNPIVQTRRSRFITVFIHSLELA